MSTDLDTRYNTQWVEFHIRDRLENGQVTVHHTVIEEYRSFSLQESQYFSGEFYSPGNRRKSLTEEEIDEIVIPSDGIGEISAGGRRGSEGRLDLFHDDAKICELHWENRGGNHVNLVEVLDNCDKYRVECGGWSPEVGPLGHVFVDISSKKK
ncbi:uncharacterized protein N7484_007528 [Penicillium longicatenatum]|uniref:uncharacterized protein n=1 Tax=Penicillium longicatenatum TaxID=1561947 RepID=UPI0025474B92|nr:uncharacterized protein N7484_007528 [Penicillium longicatenatum]KAJ5639666.1 hypothetical protein N7484_007528 [Penicillium longicatenatum]